MATFTINTRKHGEIKFVARDNGGYVRVYGNKWDGKQPCEGGGFMGSTLMADERTLEAKSRKWWKAFLASQREFAL